ncbi:MAG: hypothetical protein ACUVV4_04390 [Candidatus Bathyarchaeia archaeon]
MKEAHAPAIVSPYILIELGFRVLLSFSSTSTRREKKERIPPDSWRMGGPRGVCVIGDGNGE